ncbi:DEAD/DEAH box helicase [Allorhizobium taibaishanense]|uniref:Superfamily II DNA or RNA helicase n=1 Tax=Allorhizobium taibaishanense TaxID=887144 RepID=A0A1Q9AC20_9HYPH|nr:DEAD/DEAH box helicase [Allorhizobium taibaishanense]MBB4010280.1 superfamily II DNA or RNA helicase [Allorhizobium taibaishanense]OLP52388.1 hypothetical protein BJF91_02345 [Allorhizobium taibaishanense]
MIQELSDRIWKNSVFHSQLDTLIGAWLQHELQITATMNLSDKDMARCIQAAAILSKSDDPMRQRAAYSIAACANDLRSEELPGLAGTLRLVLTGLGNFPAFTTSAVINDFRRLPMQSAVYEELRRATNAVSIGDETVVLTDFQARLWQLLTGGYRVAISAPTSAGKSFVLQQYLRGLVRAGKLEQACYIVPSRALIAQVTDAIVTWRQANGFVDVSVINVPMTAEVELPRKAIFVLTQERLQALMGSHPDFAPTLIISDEAQSIEEGSRGVLLQNVIDKLLARSPNAQLVFAGPNIKNLDAFAKIFGIDKVEEVQSRSPSVVQNLIVVNTRSPIRGRVSVQRLTADGRTDLGYMEIGKALPSTRERLVRIADRFGRQKPSIVYANRPSDAEGVALGLEELNRSTEPNERLLELSEFVKVAVHPEYDLAKCLLRGIGFHYGRIPALVRRGVESAFSDGDIRFLVTTSTLIQGVNFPAANLFVCKPKKGQSTDLEPAEFWNLAGRAGRLGKEFQGNIFLIDYDEWTTSPADKGNEIELKSFLTETLSTRLDEVEACALESNPQRETSDLADVEATFARLLADHMAGRLDQTLTRCDVEEGDRDRLRKALDVAQSRVSLPSETIEAAPTVSALRQQRLATYLKSEIKGGGIRRLEELIPRHPRDDAAWKTLSEIYRICHERILSVDVPKLHLRMAAISLSWMRGDPLPAIIEKNREYNKGDTISAVIRNTLNDIEQEVRFKYFRLATCYISVLAHCLKESGHTDYLSSLSSLPTYLEMGASDQTMISFIALGLSRHTAKELMEFTVEKEMDPATALKWLRQENFDSRIASPMVRQDIVRVLESAGAA